MVLEINNLTFGYTKDRLLYKDFSLSVKRGEIVAITGASGSGKSTLLDLIMRDLKPHSGEIKVQKATQIFQDPYSSFHPSYTIKEQIEEVATLHDKYYYLKSLNLKEELLFQKPHKLSGGELQRCSILRSILQKPYLLLADEPTSALDNVSALEVMKLLVRFLDRVGVLLITHDLDLASWCSDRVIQLDKKRV